jgi:archaellum component FlaC
LLKKIREDLEKSLKEADNIAKSAQQSLQNMARLSDELKKLAEELRKPPATTTPTTTRPSR